MATRQHGTIKFFNDAKGYGFIKPDAGGNDIFVHISAAELLRSPLHEGLRLSYELMEDKKGKPPKAVSLALE